MADDAAESARARIDERATLPDIFARACVKFADKIALDIPPTSTRARVRLTYRELDALSRAVAELVAEYVEPIAATNGASDNIVALALARTDARLYAAMLGAMRAGCAYCAIDPAFPAQQASEILRDSKAIALVCDTARAESIAQARQAHRRASRLSTRALRILSRVTFMSFNSRTLIASCKVRQRVTTRASRNSGLRGLLEQPLL